MAGFVAGAVIAAAVTLLFVKAWEVDAAPGDSDTTFVAMTPCRLIDTRPGDDRVGSHGGFGIDDTKTIAARGTNGKCVIPADAVGLSLNVTAVGATAASFLTIWPDGTRPKASSLNPAPGQPPTPNAVTTNLSGGGAFKIYNKAGTVDVIVDVNGYYTKTSLQDIAALQTQMAIVQGELAIAQDRVASLQKAQPFTVTTFDHVSTPLALTPSDYLSLSVNAPVDGDVSLHSLASFEHGIEGADVACVIEIAADVPGDFLTGHFIQFWEVTGASNETSFSGTRSFEVSAGSTTEYVLACQGFEEGGTIQSRNMTAIFTAAP